MTTPASFTVSLDWAKKLKDAGWPQDDALFWWHHWFDGEDRKTELQPSGVSLTTFAAAPTAEDTGAWSLRGFMVA